jgi:hypothetical protein
MVQVAFSNELARFGRIPVFSNGPTLINFTAHLGFGGLAIQGATPRILWH